MTRLLILAEGQSEEVFAKRTLMPHLAAFGVHANVTILRTKRIMSGGGFHGGVSSYAKIRQNVLELLGDTNARVTTLLDFYGLPEEFPARAATLVAPGLTARDKAIRLQQAFSADIGQPRFIPFLALHEFEAWLFSKPETVAEHFGNSALTAALTNILQQAGAPEAINNDPATHPSARVERLIPSFKKTSDGPTIIHKTTLATIRAACPHFGEWLSALEGLGNPAGALPDAA
ncbi:MAG: DUF4276 family protein [Rhodanobacteraceae bacterium]|nr:DUF4276 family protein [Rhodanobacteraceae bacterium]